MWVHFRSAAGRFWTAGAAGLVALASTTLAGQQASPQATAPQSEQVHTGTSSGLNSEARLEALLADHQFLRIENQLGKMSPEQAAFYRGILANRDNDPKKSIELLAPLIEKVSASGNVSEEKLLRKALAEDYLRTGDMTKAAAAYAALAERGHLTPEELDEIELPLKLAPLAAGNPPMTVEPYEPFLLQVARNPLGLTELPVYVDARPHSWMMDPTAPFNLIARSEAKEAGLKISADSATIHTLTGRLMVVHATVIPRFTLGGRITFRNMTAFVFEDADYAFPGSQFHAEGLLGYPAFAALGSLTVTADATIEVRPLKAMQATERADPPTDGARFYLDGEQMIVAIGAKGQEQMFTVDASGQQTYLTSRYYDEHMDDFNGMKMALFSILGAETKPPQPAYRAETVQLTIGPAEVEAHSLQVITAPVGLAALDDVYGVLGMDFLEQMKSYTFDYRSMRFGVRTE